MGKTSSRRGSDLTSETSQRKRKGPPKFQHLPHATAKKLKLQWVERKKLQSQYFGKGQKKKAATQPGAAGEKADAEDEEWEDDSEAAADEEDEADEAFDGFPDGMEEDAILDSDEFGTLNSEDPEDFRMRTPSVDETTLADSYRDGASLKREMELPALPRRAARQPSSSNPPPVAKGYQDGTSLGRVDRKGSVRRPSESSGGAGAEDVRRGQAAGRGERAREEREEAARRRARAKAAYGQESLHTYKSDPLRKQQVNGGGRGQGQGRRGEKGKGQPDMRLRMNSLLETIKKNVGA